MFYRIPESSFAFVVVGILGSGRSTFIAAICEESWLQEPYDAYSEEAERRGSGAEFGRMLMEWGQFYFFARAFSDYDSSRYKIFWKFLEEKTDGIIVLVDSSTPETFNATRNIVFNVKRYVSCPFVIAANKQDLPDAWTADDIRIALSIPPEIPVLPCSTHDKKSVANVLIALCEEIIKDSN